MALKRPPVLERTVEKAFVKGVEKLGCITRKLNGAGARSWPDRLVLGPRGFVMFVELKRPGGKATPLQEDMIYTLEAMDHDVGTFDDAAVAVAAVATRLAFLSQ